MMISHLSQCGFMQIIDKSAALRIPPFFRLAFRPFFLSASLFSVLAMVVWAAFWSGKTFVPLYGNPVWWHAHEMLIGFTGAIIVGFLLTAVQNWTGIPGVHGWKLASVFSGWLIARVMLLLSHPHWLWMIADQLWIVLAIVFLAVPILKQKQWRNLFFVPLLALLIALNLMMHFAVLGWSSTDFSVVSRQLTLLIAVIMIVMGGRVIPFFTARGTQTEPITRVPWREFLALIPAWGALIAGLLGQSVVPAVWFGWICMVAAIAQIPRVIRWRTLQTFKEPLLWLLHFAYYSTILGLFLIGLSSVEPQYVSDSVALHVLTVGGIGGMILAMIVRVSLGHTGRKLQTGLMIRVAFITLIIAMCFRTIVIIFMPGMMIHAFVLSAILWAVAYGIFVLCFWRVLTRARLDGNPG
ncbi:NnrS family protein [Photobacterium sp. 1_MG-2023]|uniref:NnrS family protein n=1 Tax=Photobacterium sp. 1_MG-2023 TaxID=3062646 RepID=UPI0026E2F931|nr:NnrS family protein [Photobacterium sp. 1_MG-2023]MDO6706987.1 NnrS family protein [Photobacterium sp. 1_MG-2023]